MPQLPDPFKTLPDWSLNSAHYPAVFLIDKSWADTNDYAIQAGSETTDSLTESYPLAAPLVGQPTPHGETTQYIIQYMAPGLPNEKITLISVERKRDDSMRYKLSPRNLPEALVSIRAQLNPGDLVVINVGFNGAGDSFARDPLVASYLNEITDIFHSIVVMAAGNDEALLSHTLAPNAVVVGGVDESAVVQSRYGEYVTCYGVVPYDLPDYPVQVKFGRSSAATAYTAGMVLMMLNYAWSKGRKLTSKEVVNLLKNNGIEFNVLTNTGDKLATGSLPNWAILRSEIDKLVNPTN